MLLTLLGVPLLETWEEESHLLGAGICWRIRFILTLLEFGLGAAIAGAIALHGQS